jgi:hypothetical protein
MTWTGAVAMETEDRVRYSSDAELAGLADEMEVCV